jgi:hypothetical protein
MFTWDSFFFGFCVKPGFLRMKYQKKTDFSFNNLIVAFSKNKGGLYG